MTNQPEVKVGVSFSEEDMQRMREQVHDLKKQLGALPIGRGTDGRFIWKTRGGRSGSTQGGLSLLDRALIYTGVKPRSGLTAISMPMFGPRRPGTTSILNDPSTGDWNRSQFATAPTASSPVRGLLYRTRAIAAGTPLMLFRSSLVMWLLDKTNRAVQGVSASAREMAGDDPSMMYSAVGLKAQESFPLSWENISKGAARGSAAMTGIINNIVTGIGMAGNMVANFVNGGSYEQYARMQGQALMNSHDNWLDMEYKLLGSESALGKRMAKLDKLSEERDNITTRAMQVANNSWERFLAGGTLERLSEIGGKTVEELADDFKHLRAHAYRMSRAAAGGFELDSEIQKLAGLGSDGSR